MASPAAQNELEKLDMLLSKLDAVRYALPEVLDFFMNPTAGLSTSGNAQDTIQDYRYRVDRAERSLQDLQRSSASSLTGVSSRDVIDIKLTAISVSAWSTTQAACRI